MNKLSALGTKGKFYVWIKSFLFERSEIVVVEGVKVEAYAMTSDVPQGSCIGPLLFLAYVNDIDVYLSFSHILQYDEDKKIYKSLNLVDKKSSRTELQSDLIYLDNWENNSQLPFNLSKCSSLQFGHLLLAHNYTLAGKCIPSKPQEKDLGVTIPTDLKQSVHVAKVVKQAQMCLAVKKRMIVSQMLQFFSDCIGSW